MKAEDEIKDPECEPAIPYAWAILLSVFIVMGGLFFGLPLLLIQIPSQAAQALVVLLVVPAFPTVSGWLQGCMDSRLPGEKGLRTLPREYLYQTWSLTLELTLLLASLPTILAQLISVIAAIMVVAFGAVLIVALAQHAFGLRLQGVTVFGTADIWTAGKIVLGGVGAATGFWALGAALERVFNRSVDLATVMNLRVNRWLCRHV